MTIHELIDAVHKPEIKQQLLAGYDGYFCLQVRRSGDSFVVKLNVERIEDYFPTSISINGVDYPVEVEGGYVVFLRMSGALGKKAELQENGF